MSDVTQILSQIESGDPLAEKLLPLVYDELRKLAESISTSYPGAKWTLAPAKPV